MIFQILSTIILAITGVFIIWYTYETFKIRKSEEKPIMGLYIRYIKDCTEDESYEITIKDSTRHSGLVFRLRNMGRGVAFNIRLESALFDIQKIEELFFAPLKDEHCVKLVGKDNKNVESFDKFNNAILKFCCDDISKKTYCFKYKIIDVLKRKIEYLGEE